MIFFKTILIQLPTLLNTFLYTWDWKKTFKVLSFVGDAKYRLLWFSFTRHNDEKSEKKYNRKLL